MARPWRIQFPDAVYHVTSRGNNRQLIFLDDSDRSSFFNLISRAHRRFNLIIYAFCLMDNHYHLFLRTPEANLASFLQWLNSAYTSRFNLRHNRLGHLFQGRYKSVLVADEAHWLHLSMYIHLNPVRAGIVSDPAQYWWSSFRDYTCEKSRFIWLREKEILVRYGINKVNRRQRYRRDCLMLAGSKPEFWERFREDVVLGSREVLQELTEKYKPEGNEEAVPDFKSAQRPEVDVGQELMRVAKLFQVDKEELFKRRRKFPAKMAAYYHLVENCGISVTQTATLLGVSTAAVTMGINAFKDTGSELKF